MNRYFVDVSPCITPDKPEGRTPYLDKLGYTYRPVINPALRTLLHRDAVLFIT